MSTYSTLQLCLVLHLMGLVMMAGMSVADFISQKSFWKQYAVDKNAAMNIFNAAANFQKFQAIGAALLLLSGICMMALTHGAFGEQLWMKIKIVIVVLVIVNGPIVGRIQVNKLKKLLSSNNPLPAELMAMKTRNTLVSVLNLLFLATIVILSVFKFN